MPVDMDLVVIAGSATVVTIVISMYRLARAWIERRTHPALPPTLTHLDERLARMEQAIDAMAIEVERISEGQRFTTKLLAERNAAALPERVTS